MTATMTVNDMLVEFGSLEDNTQQSIQRVGARLVESFFDSFDPATVDTETTANVLYYLTEIQVRDYMLGLIGRYETEKVKQTLEHLLNAAPINTVYINAPACLLAVVHYELSEVKEAYLVLSNATEDYSLGSLLRRVFQAGWLPEMFEQMRKDIHSSVVEGIFGDEA